MIKSPTLFVLGAGASADYGFPTGHELIYQLTREDLEAEWPSIYGHETSQQVKNAKNALAKSSLRVVDNYLKVISQNSSRKGEMSIILKLIAQIIGKHERNFLDKPLTILPDRHLWFTHLFSRMQENCNTFDEFLNENNVHFYTFNYDRLLEFMFCRSLSVVYDLDEGDILPSLKKKFTLLHVHGSLGDLVTSNPDQRVPFGFKMDANDEAYFKEIPRAAQFLRCAHDVDETNSDIIPMQTIEVWSQSSPRIVFLGFGFDIANLKKIGYHKIFWAGGIFASAKNVSARVMLDLETTRMGHVRNTSQKIVYLPSIAEIVEELGR